MIRSLSVSDKGFCYLLYGQNFDRVDVRSDGVFRLHLDKSSYVILELGSIPSLYIQHLDLVLYAKGNQLVIFMLLCMSTCLLFDNVAHMVCWIPYGCVVLVHLKWTWLEVCPFKLQLCVSLETWSGLRLLCCKLSCALFS